MLRFGEAAIALAPLAGLAIVYFVLLRGQRVSSRMLALAVLAVVGLGVWLTWLGTSQRLDPGQNYVPAQLHDGEVVAGHARP